jgi:SNF2 family DNA or RNA helicase
MPHQIEGLNWLVNLFEMGYNGILADDTGMGKTIEVAALLAYLKDYYGVKGKHLIVVPKNVIYKWKRELTKWIPSFRVALLLSN